ncbi:hypothetical protein [Maribacter sp. ACAM166]|uniref:hypothetical protein n=1 Tax=Maribacter sp. ACAM166 TaxID=2508996 RepID=UPI0010FDDB78|nr:hypothetical protein [Maribacter sp. ACAM166]TLP81366.1 hypothetical protein ES765_04990 [Maribacter sp. ACAM166]
MNKADKAALEKYREKLKFVRSSGASINPNETADQKKARIHRAKKDVRFCVQYYFPHYATSESAEFQIQSANYTLKHKTAKQFDEWGRGLAKSVWDDVIKPFWLWMNNEAHYHVIVTTSYDRACELAEDLRAEWEGNPRIINDFGKQQNTGQWEKGFYITKSGFICKALGAGQSVRGLRVKDQRPDLITVDDLETKETIANPKRQKKLAKWIERDLIPTMDGPIRRFLYANNRFAPMMIQTILQEKHPNWKIFHVKAYNKVTYAPAWPHKYSPTYYKELEDEIGTLACLAEYNGEPHVEGEIFKEKQIQWGKMPALNHFKILIGRWDVAYAGTPTSDFNAVKIWGLHGRDFWNVDNYVKQSKMRGALEWMAQVQLSLPDSVIIHWGFESQFWNDEVKRTIDEVERDFGIILNLAEIPTSPRNKYDRIITLQSYYQNGRLFYNEKLKSHNDTQVGLTQLYGIEPGYNTKDDAPDADESAIKACSKYIYSGTGKSKPTTGKFKRKPRF